MNRQILIRRLFAILVVAGLVLAPLSQPAMAGAMADASTSAMEDDMSPFATPDIGGAAPCCPAKAPASIDCDKCVFIAACTTQCMIGISATLFRPPFAFSSMIEPLRNDAWPEGLGHPPPEDPPRTLV